MQHTITLGGTAARGSTISWNALSALGGSISEISKRVLRLRATGKSNLHGLPEWLNHATLIDLKLLSDKNSEPFETANAPTKLLVEAPSLVVAAPDIFSQLQFWGESISPQDTAISLLEMAVRSAVDGDAQSDLIDRGILGSIASFSNVFDLGFNSISLNGGPTPAVEITPSSIEVVESLVAIAPEPQKIVVSGTLDTLTASRRFFVLNLENGRKIRGFYPPDISASIASNYGQKVVIDGEATFRPSGEISTIVASSIQQYREGDSIWGTVPVARPRSLEDIQSPARAKVGGNAFARLFGSWPGDETDQEIEKVLSIIG